VLGGRPRGDGSAARRRIRSLLIGSSLAHYRITAKLGAGGMGEVYRAEDAHLSRDVAIKLLPAVVTADPERLARFEREAKLLASLNHPNVAAIHGFEEVEGKVFSSWSSWRGRTSPSV